MAENSKKTGRPFQKGVSGNPGGRPKIPEAFKELVQSKSIPALKSIIAIMENPESKANEIFMCAKLILEYANGKPMDNMSLTQTMTGDFIIEIGAPSEQADD